MLNITNETAGSLIEIPQDIQNKMMNFAIEVQKFCLSMFKDQSDYPELLLMNIREEYSKFETYYCTGKREDREDITVTCISLINSFSQENINSYAALHGYSVTWGQDIYKTGIGIAHLREAPWKNPFEINQKKDDASDHEKKLTI